jgi:hypothetical protein
MSFARIFAGYKWDAAMDLARVQAKIARLLEPMKPPLEGGCRCGRVRYSISAMPVWSGHCHCHACQSLSGAAFVSAFNVPVERLVLRGETTTVRRTAESGHAVTARLCAACGAWLTGQSDGNPALVAILASTLRDPTVFLAIANVYLSEAAPRITPPTTLFNFDKMPKAI